MGSSEKVLAVAVLDRERLGVDACPLLLELVEIPAEGVFAAFYWLRAYRSDEGPQGPVDSGWPFSATLPEYVARAQRAARVRWLEAGLEPLPEDAFGDGVSA